MAKKPTNKPVLASVKRGAGYPALVKAISQVNTGMVTRAATAVNQALVLRNWLIGAYIVEFEQNGADRAKYGTKLLETLARDLKTRDLKGLGLSMLERSRMLSLIYPELALTIPATLFTEFPPPGRIPYAVTTESALLDHLQRFLLELGRGSCFEARQFPMTEARRTSLRACEAWKIRVIPINNQLST